MAHHPAEGGEGFVIDGAVPLAFRQVGAQRAAHLHGFQRSATARAAAEVLHQRAQGGAERQFHQAAALHVAGQLNGQGAPGAAQAVIGVGLAALVENERHRRQGQHVVDHRGPAEQALNGGQRRLGAHLAALAFQAVQQGGFLAADVGAGAQPHFQIEVPAAAENVLAQIARRVGAPQGFIEDFLCQRVLRAQIDVALGGAHRQAGDGHALDQHVRVALHHQPVGEGAGVALVRVADDVLLARRFVVHRLPFDGGGEGGAAPAAQAGGFDLVDDALTVQGERFLQALEAAQPGVVVQGQRVGDADARESQALLVLQVGDVLGKAQGQIVVLAAVKQAGFHQRRHRLGRHRAVGHAAFRRGHFHQRLQPEQAPGAVADQRQVQAPLGGGLAQGIGHPVGAQGAGGGVGGNV